MKENSKLRMRAAMAMSSGALMLRRLGPRALVVASCAAALAPARARAAEPGPATAADVARLQGEVDRLKQDMRDQRELILQLMQAEQQRYDIILKVLRAGGGGEAAIPPPPSPASAMQKGVSGEAKEGTGGAPGGHESATISGHVRSNGGQAIGEAYVFVDGLRSNPGRGHTVEIKQKDKQFAPQVTVVQRGTTVVFPNFDPVFHNVFSPSGKNSFDLGSYRSGDQARSVVLTAPGVVEVFCNIHSRMNATILVVPSPLYAKVSSDGTFKLENVPSGTRRIVAWSPGAKPVTQKVDVTPSGAQANFTLVYEPAAVHLNKLGQPYGSYKE